MKKIIFLLLAICLCNSCSDNNSEQEPALFFDFEDYLERMVSNENNIITLKKQISRTVIYHDFTPYFLDEFSIEKSCGIGIYIPFTDDVLFERYSSLDWYKDSELFCLL